MIRNIKTNNYIKYNSSHFKNLFNKQQQGSGKYFLMKDIKHLSAAHKKLKKTQNGGNNDNVCPICLDDGVFTSNDTIIENKLVSILPCNHHFCLSCLKKFLNTCRQDAECKCPFCRGPIRGPSSMIDKLVKWLDTAVKVRLEVAIRPFKNSDVHNRRIFQHNKMTKKLDNVKNDLIYELFKPMFDNFIFRQKYNYVTKNIDNIENIVDKLNVQPDINDMHDYSKKPYKHTTAAITFEVKTSRMREHIMTENTRNFMIEMIEQFNNGSIDNQDKFVVYNDYKEEVQNTRDYYEQSLNKLIVNKRQKIEKGQKLYYFHVSPRTVALDGVYLVNNNDMQYKEVYREDDLDPREGTIPFVSSSSSIDTQNSTNQDFTNQDFTTP